MLRQVARILTWGASFFFKIHWVSQGINHNSLTLEASAPTILCKSGYFMHTSLIKKDS